MDLKWQIKLDVSRNVHVTCILRQADVGVMKLIKVRCAGHVECVEDTRNAYKSLVGNPYWKIPLVRRRRNVEDKKLKLLVVRVWTEAVCLSVVTSGRLWSSPSWTYVSVKGVDIVHGLPVTNLTP